MKNTVLSFQKAKKDGQKLAMLTAYDYSTKNYLTALVSTASLLVILLEMSC